MSFHDVLFPADIAFSSIGGPERLTQITTLASGHEVRNALWAHSRRRYQVGYGVKTLEQLHTIITFFEERRGRLYGFRFHDQRDDRSTHPKAEIVATDQRLGLGDGVQTSFQLIKTYGQFDAPYRRTITKPKLGSVRVAIDDVELQSGFSVNHATGEVTFNTPPANGAEVRAGFAFHVPVRFDTDALAIDLESFQGGAIPDIPLIEVR